MTIVLGLVGVGLICLQMIWPAWFSLTGMHLALVCFPPVYAMFYLGVTQALLLAGFLGLLQDLLSPGMPGFTALGLGCMLVLLSTQRRLVQVEGALVAAALMMLGTFFYLVLDYLFFSLRLGRWSWSLHLGLRMVGEAFINGLLFPLLSWPMDALQSQWYGKNWKRRINYADH